MGVCLLTPPSKVASRGSALVVIVTPLVCTWYIPGIPVNSAGWWVDVRVSPGESGATVCFFGAKERAIFFPKVPMSICSNTTLSSKRSAKLERAMANSRSPPKIGVLMTVTCSARHRREVWVSGDVSVGDAAPWGETVACGIANPSNSSCISSASRDAIVFTAA